MNKKRIHYFIFQYIFIQVKIYDINSLLWKCSHGNSSECARVKRIWKLFRWKFFIRSLEELRNLVVSYCVQVWDPDFHLVIHSLRDNTLFLMGLFLKTVLWANNFSYIQNYKILAKEFCFLIIRNIIIVFVAYTW